MRVFTTWTLLGVGILFSALLCWAASTGGFTVLGISPGPMNDILEVAVFILSGGMAIGLIAVAISKIWKGIDGNQQRDD